MTCKQCKKRMRIKVKGFYMYHVCDNCDREVRTHKLIFFDEREI
jgi:hypothetical protein